MVRYVVQSDAWSERGATPTLTLPRKGGGDTSAGGSTRFALRAGLSQTGEGKGEARR